MENLRKSPSLFSAGEQYNIKSFPMLNMEYVGFIHNLNTLRSKIYMDYNYTRSSLDQLKLTNAKIFNGKGPLFPQGPFRDQPPLPHPKVGDRFQDLSWMHPKQYNELLAETIINDCRAVGDITNNKLWSKEQIMNNLEILKLYKVFYWVVAKRIYMNGGKTTTDEYLPLTNDEWNFTTQLFNQWINEYILIEAEFRNLLSNTGNQDIPNKLLIPGIADDIRYNIIAPYLRQRLGVNNEYKFY